MTPTGPRILLIEDSPLDAELAIAQLEAAGLAGDARVVATRAKYLASLAETCEFDLIISDYDLPSFNGFEALRLARERCADVPFVFLSGKLGEDHAVEALREGATDYVVKQRIERLVPAVRRALAEARERQDRRSAEDALRQSQEKMMMVVKGANVGVWYCPLPFDRLIWDEKVKEHFHIPPDAEVTIEMFFDRLHPDDRERTRQAIDLSISRKQPYDIDYRTVAPDGSALKWIRATGRGFYDPDGNPTRFDGITIDVTDRMLAEERAREESNIVEITNSIGRSVAAELDLGILVQTITDATTALCGAQFGAFFYNVVDERGESYSLFTVSGVSRDNFEKFPMPRNTEVFASTFNGRGVLRLADVTADPRYGRNAPYRGMPPGHLKVRSYLALPVTSRSGDVLGGLFFGHADTGVFTERHERILSGIAAQAAVAIDNARLYEAVRRANAEKDKLLERERAARNEVERASSMKDEFLATLSHELRTPLNAILGWSQILLTAPPDHDDLVEGLNVIERNARAQTRIIEDLLDMSRIISGKVRLEVKSLDLGSVVQAAIETVRPAANAKGVRIVSVLDSSAGIVNGDANRLQQVFWNLLSNAVKFTPRGGRVQIVLERVNSHVEVNVVDTGEGIRADFLPHVFDRFRQSDASTTRRHGGLGLGLAIAKQLIELHGGSIRARSDGDGHGATFAVALPLMAIRPHTDAEPRHRHANLDGHSIPSAVCQSITGLKALVVDDEPDARSLVKRVLGDCGVEVIVAASAAEAFELVQSERPDVIVSDVGMPLEDGYSLIRRIRALPADRGACTPAIALTAYARAEDRVKAIAAGFQHHVCKPLDPVELIAMIASLAPQQKR